MFPALRMWPVAPLRRALVRTNSTAFVTLRAAVVGNQIAFDRVEGPGRDQHRADGGADDSLQVASEVPLGKVSLLPAFANDNEVAPRFEFLQGVDQGAMTLSESDLSHARGLELLARMVEDGLALEAGHTPWASSKMANCCVRWSLASNPMLPLKSTPAARSR
jgi:hypothetical protein